MNVRRRQNAPFRKIADYVINALAKQGCKAYLAGGAAIALRGGGRPIADVDLRTDGKPGDTFASGDGLILLNAINKLLLPRARLDQKVAINEFHRIGEDAVTIGTNWGDVEVSLTLHQGFSHMPLVSLSGVPALDPLDLVRDKLKTVISRTKRGEASVKKVAQDLFDVLTVVRLLPPEATRDIDALVRQFRERSEQYSIANLEQFDLPEHFKGDIMALRMLDRFLFTVRAHLQKGPRQDKLMGLIEKHDPALIDPLKHFGSLDLGEIRPGPVPGWSYRAYWREVSTTLLHLFAGYASEARQAVVSHILDYADELDLRLFFAVWNRDPFDLPPRLAPPRKRPVHTTPRLMLPPTIVALDDLPAIKLLTGCPVSVKSNEDKVIYILFRSTKGLRKLADSKDEAQVNFAFGMSKNQFSKAFSSLRSLKLVEASDAGLTLTEAGAKYIQEKYKEWK
jgi:hypothetical protein